jgi:hypothetical protein
MGVSDMCWVWCNSIVQKRIQLMNFGKTCVEYVLMELFGKQISANIWVLKHSGIYSMIYSLQNSSI